MSRFSRVELHRLVVERGVTEASARRSSAGCTTTRSSRGRRGRGSSARQRSLRRPPRALDLYARLFEGKRLRPDEYVICADEKTQLQALGRRHDTVPPGPGRPGLVEFDYLRGGTLAYLAAWDVAPRQAV
jgi:hypothetical protein